MENWWKRESILEKGTFHFLISEKFEFKSFQTFSLFTPFEPFIYAYVSKKKIIVKIE